MMKIEERMVGGKMVKCKCYYSARNGKMHITKIRPIRPRKPRSDKGKKRGQNIRTKRKNLPSEETQKIEKNTNQHS